MKKMFTIIFLLIFLLGTAQKKYYILFNHKTDKIENMDKYGATFYIALPNSKSIFFGGGEVKKNYINVYFNLRLNTPREKLKKIIESDSGDKTDIEYVVVLKRGDKYYYYYVDHIVRRIVDYLDQ